MLRVPLLCLAFLAAAWLEFTVFPGHSYLEGETQLYVPLLERMDAPGLLSRDLVATNGTLSLTAYDEATLLLHEAGRQPLRRALLLQLFAFRLAALIGVFLLARATGLNELFAIVTAAIVNLGATLTGPAAALTNREPVPGAFSFSLIVLAMGLLAQDLPLLAGLSAGVAFLYDPILALPFWIVLLVAFFSDRGMRILVRPMLPVLVVFVLLLANLAQLQPGTAAEPILTRVPAALAAFQQTHAPRLYISAWPKGEIYELLALLVLGLWAAARCWSLLHRCFRWLVLGTAACGLLSLPLSFFLLDEAHFNWIARLQPSRTLLFGALAASLLFALAGMRAMLHRSIREALAWFFLLFLLPATTGMFHFQLTRFTIAIGLAGLLTGLLAIRWAVVAVPVIAAFVLAQAPGLLPKPVPFGASMAKMGSWADATTWGSSVFLFPEAGQAKYPGAFRADSRHALWTDWKSAQGVLFSEKAAMLWQQRWSDTMEGGFSTAKLERLLPLPIDYYVLTKQTELAGPKPAFTNRDFVVYEAEDLRNAAKPLRIRRSD